MDPFKKMMSYVGIIGLSSKDEVLNVFKSLPFSGKKLLIGVPIDWHSYRGGESQYNGVQCFNYLEPQKIFINSFQILNLVYFIANSPIGYEKCEILKQILLIHHRMVGSNFNGFLFNVGRENFLAIRDYREIVGNKFDIIVEVDKSLRGYKVEDLFRIFSKYCYMANGILLHFNKENSSKVFSFLEKVGSWEYNKTLNVGVIIDARLLLKKGNNILEKIFKKHKEASVVIINSNANINQAKKFLKKINKAPY